MQNPTSCCRKSLNREMEKYYLAIVDGIPSPENGRIDVPLAESTVTRVQNVGT
ncbi:MAG: hypothetical protein IPN86_24690 [Saprospiraceae bacterium]|nr:hypothetical protein [Saprospiraceae bacterium]